NTSILQAMQTYLVAIGPGIYADLLAYVGTITTVTQAVITELWSRISLPGTAQDIGMLSSMVNALTIGPGITPTAGAVTLPYLQSLVARSNALIAAGGTLNASDKNALQADVTALVPAGGGNTVPPLTSLTDNEGAVWTLDTSGGSG